MESIDYKTKDFSFAASGFSFKYPLFHNWENVEIREDSEGNYSTEIGWSGFTEIPPTAPLEMKEPIKPPSISIYIKKVFPLPRYEDEEWHSAAIYTNPQGINFRFLDDPHLKNPERRNFVEFYLKDCAVKIEIPAYDNHGFSTDIFWRVVTESFQSRRINPEP